MEDYNRLDVAAKLFPAVANKNNSSVFRLAVILKEEIEPKTLQLAVNLIYERYNLYFLRLRQGVFWNYFDTNHIHFTVEEEDASPCSTIVSHENKGYIIKVLYYKNRISVEAFHSIADGSGIIEFIKSLIYYYIVLKHGPISPQGKVLLFDELDDSSSEDSFTKNFSKHPKEKTAKIKKQENAFRIRGRKYSKRGHCVVTGVISVKNLKEKCKEHKCSITTFLISNLIMSIYEEKQKISHNNKPIVIAVPVNLRKIFDSSTLRNFFGVVNVRVSMTTNTTFDEILKSIADQLTASLDPKYFEEALGKNYKLSNNVVTKHTPLVFKNMVMPLGFRYMGELKKTISMSNIGQIDFPDGVKPYVEHTEVLMYPTAKSPMNCAICSFEDKLSINFTRSITDASIIRNFFTSLALITDSDIYIYSNIWGTENEQM